MDVVRGDTGKVECLIDFLAGAGVEKGDWERVYWELLVEGRSEVGNVVLRADSWDANGWSLVWG